MKHTGINGVELIAVNTDAADLLKVKADRKILIGKKTTSGLGAGAEPKVGEAAAREDEKAILDAIKDADLVFVTCGLGGGTGTGAAPVVAEIVRGAGILTVGVVTLPFAAEGYDRMRNAQGGLERMRAAIDTLIVIPNDKLMQLIPDVPIRTAFMICDEILMNAVKGMSELVTKPGLINVDFADLRTTMRDGGVGVIGIGESNTENKQLDAVEKAIHNPLLSVNIMNAKNALVNVTGGPELTLHQAHDVVGAVSAQLDPEARVIWGAHIDEELKDVMRVMIIVTGIPEETFELAKPKSRAADTGATNTTQARKKKLEVVDEDFRHTKELALEFGLDVVAPLTLGKL